MTACSAIGIGGSEDDGLDVEEFYADNDLRIVVGFSAGGGYDFFARLVADHISKHLPGNPTVYVENMDGAGSLTAANYMANSAPADGSTVATFASGLALQDAVGDDAIRFSITDFNWLGAVMSDINVCVARDDSLASLDDLLPPTREQLTIGTTGAGSTDDMFPRAMNTMLNTDIRVVAGYQGNAETRLAVQRSEVAGYCAVYQTADRTQAEWDFDWHYFVQFAPDADEALPDIPNVFDLVTGVDQEVLRLAVAPDRFFFPFAFPPGVPEERVEAFRTALMATFEDPDFIAAAGEAGYTLSPVTADEIGSILQEFETAEPEVIDGLATLLSGG